MIEEIWKPVIGYEGLYEVSNYGNVKSLFRTIKYYRADYGRICTKNLLERMMKFDVTYDGYNSVTLTKDRKSKTYLVHRLVAFAFIGNPPEGKDQINHKDGNKQNNFVRNLEWCDQFENAKHALEIGLRQGSMKSIRCVNDGKEFHSITEASNYYHLDHETVSLHIDKKTFSNYSKCNLSFERI